MFKTNAILAAALCTAGLLAAPAAFAKSTQVSYADLDLASTTGRQALDARVARAARSVCQIERTGSLIRSVDQACYRQALANTRDRVAAAVDASREQLGG
jgi:UrcA family protein